jgi:hypothetical protein
MPAGHRAGRIAIMTVLVALILGFGLSGAPVGVVRWAGDCGQSVIHLLWSPLRDDNGGSSPPPAAACFHQQDGSAAG